jgi:hypothetical protein
VRPADVRLVVVLVLVFVFVFVFVFVLAYIFLRRIFILGHPSKSVLIAGLNELVGKGAHGIPSGTANTAAKKINSVDLLNYWLTAGFRPQNRTLLR